jgi:hypothetical protein
VQAAVHERIMRAGGWRLVDLVSVPVLARSTALSDLRPAWTMFALPSGLHLLTLMDDARGARWPEGTLSVSAEHAERLMCMYPWPRPMPDPTREGWAVVPTSPPSDLIFPYTDRDGRTLPGARPPVLVFAPLPGPTA